MKFDETTEGTENAERSFGVFGGHSLGTNDLGADPFSRARLTRRPPAR